MSTTNSGSPTKKSLVILTIIAIIGLGIWAGMTLLKRNLFTVMKVPKFKLTNQYGQLVSNKDLEGKVYLVEFFFSTCPTICPVMNTNMKYIKDKIDNNNFDIVSISIDPSNDTPEVLLAHAKKLGVQDSKNWHFLTGDRSYIGNLAKEFNIYVGDQKDKTESLNHSGMIALVDQEGNIRCRFDKKNMPILYYSGLNYEDPEGKVPQLMGKFHPDREYLIEDIKTLLK